MPTRARFHTIDTQAAGVRVLALVDMDDGATSITNDAEAVIRSLVLGPRDRVIYRDTEGRWDELVVVHPNRFVGFEHIGAASLEEALQHIADENAGKAGA